MRRRTAAPLLAVAVAVAAAAGPTVDALSGGGSPDAGPPAASPVGPDPGTRDEAGNDAAGRLVDVESARPDAAAPTRVRVPGLGISSSLDRIGTGADGRLETPPQWQVAGWFDEGPRPGEVGPAVIAGHVDSPDGPAVFAELDRLRPGDVVEVDRAGAGGAGSTVAFRVDRLARTPRDAFPTAAVYGPTPDAQLRLITCDGPYDAESGGYRDNLVVFASRVEL